MRRRAFPIFWMLLLSILFSFLGPTGMFAQSKATVKLTLGMYWWGAAVQDAIDESLQRYIEANPHVKIDKIVQGPEALLVQLVGGTPPDVTHVRPLNFPDLVSAGFLAPLDNLLSRTKLQGEVFPAYWDVFRVDGQIFGVPALETGPRLGLVWNTSMLDDAGLSFSPDAVLRWDEFLGYADKLTRVDADGKVTRIGFNPRQDKNVVNDFLRAPLLTGTHWMNQETGLPQLDASPVVNLIDQFADRIYRKNPGWFGGTGWYRFPSEESAITILGVYAPGEIRARNPDLAFSIGWVPHIEARRTQELMAHCLAIPVGAKNVEEGMKLIEFLATDVTHQMNMMSKVGFMGPGHSFIRHLARNINDRSLLWYVESMSQVDVLKARVWPLIGTDAQDLFSKAVDSAFGLKEPARVALTEANRQLITRMRERGL